MQPSVHLLDNAADRELGKRWELAFCELAAAYGRAFSPMQIGHLGAASWRLGSSTFLLPDVTIWTAPGEHHEIKHKNPTPGRRYGLEVYRFDALMAFREVTQQAVYYSIHDWEAAGAISGRVAMANHSWDWRTIEIGQLAAKLPTPVPARTWCNGVEAIKPTYYWPAAWWGPLVVVWGGVPF